MPIKLFGMHSDKRYGIHSDFCYLNSLYVCECVYTISGTGRGQGHWILLELVLQVTVGQLMQILEPI